MTDYADILAIADQAEGSVAIRLARAVRELVEENARLKAEPTEEVFRSMSEGKRLVAYYKALVEKQKTELAALKAV